MLNVIDEFTHECLAIRIDRKLKAVDVIGRTMLPKRRTSAALGDMQVMSDMFDTGAAARGA